MKNRNKSTTFIDISYTRSWVFFILSTFKRMIVETKKTVPFKAGLFIVFLLRYLLVLPKILFVIEDLILDIITFK
jgi:hypothetical protein